MFCNRCGEKNPDGSNFCKRCGAYITAPSAVGSAAANENADKIAAASGDAAENEAASVGAADNAAVNENASGGVGESDGAADKCSICGANCGDNSGENDVKTADAAPQNVVLTESAQPTPSAQPTTPSQYPQQYPPQYIRQPDGRTVQVVYVQAPRKEPSKASRVVVALAKAAAYIAGYVGIQSAVLVVWMLSLMFGSDVLPTIMGGDHTEVYNALMARLGDGIHYALILSAALTILILDIIFRIRGKRLAAETGTLPLVPAQGESRAFVYLRTLPVIAVFAVAMQFFFNFALGYIIPEGVMKSFEEAQSLIIGGPLWAQIVDIAIFTPILEEIIFRGLSYTRLRRAMPVWVAVAVSAVVFGAMHGHIVSFIYATILGVVMACLFERFDSLIASIAFHFAFNLASFIPLPTGTTEQIIMFATSTLLVLILALYLFKLTPKPGRR